MTKPKKELPPLTDREREALEKLDQVVALTETIARLQAEKKILLKEVHAFGKIRGLSPVRKVEAGGRYISIKLLRNYVSDRVLELCTRRKDNSEYYTLYRPTLERIWS